MLIFFEHVFVKRDTFPALPGFIQGHANVKIRGDRVHAGEGRMDGEIHTVRGGGAVDVWRVRADSRSERQHGLRHEVA